MDCAVLRGIGDLHMSLLGGTGQALEFRLRVWHSCDNEWGTGLLILNYVDQAAALVDTYKENENGFDRADK
jgi:hypothetical protein